MSESLGVSGDFDGDRADAIARAIFADKELTPDEKIKLIIQQVFHGNTALAMAHWSEVTLGLAEEEEKKKLDFSLAVAVVNMEIRAEYKALETKHADILQKLANGDLFSDKANFNTHFDQFRLFTNDSISFLCKYDSSLIPEAQNVALHNNLFTMGTKAVKLLGSADAVEKHNITIHGDTFVQTDKATMTCHLAEGATKLYNLGLIKNPCGNEHNEDLKKMSELMGVSIKDLQHLKLSELKQKIEWVGKFDNIATQPEKYSDLMNKNTDPRLDAFRHKDYNSLNQAEKIVLATSVRDITIEEKKSQISADMRTRGRSEEDIAKATGDFNLVNNSDYSPEKLDKWLKDMDAKFVKDISGELRGKVKWEMENATADKPAGEVSKKTFELALPELLATNPGIAKEQLMTKFNESSQFRQSISKTIEAGVNTHDKDVSAKNNAYKLDLMVQSILGPEALEIFSAKLQSSPTPLVLKPAELKKDGALIMRPAEPEKTNGETLIINQNSSIPLSMPPFTKAENPIAPKNPPDGLPPEALAKVNAIKTAQENPAAATAPDTPPAPANPNMIASSATKSSGQSLPA